MKPEICIVVAVAKNGVIGGHNQLPWHLTADLKHFKLLTLGHPTIMGRKTFESIGRALPGRHNIVITRDPNFTAPDCTLTHSLEAAIDIATKDNPERICIIGGGQIFQQALPLTDTIYITYVDAEPEGDIYFNINVDDWREISREDHMADEKNPSNYSFVQLVRS
nr:Dihydrofolate reductase [uncultured bacterium]AIA16790.1 Dihydrofolate reductase [uncultured bacterium]